MSNASERIGIEFISVFAQPPVEFVHTAADLGCRHIGLALAPFTANPHDYASWSLRDDKALRNATLGAMRERDVSVSLGEGFLIRPGVEARNYAADLDLMRELGAPRVNVVSIEPDLPRSYDELAIIAELAAARGMRTTLEYMPRLAIGDLAGAIAAIDHAGGDQIGVLLDMMHFMRSGGSPPELKTHAARIDYIQLCDCPWVAKIPDYGAEARDNRLAPGEGELPIAAILAALPKDLAVGLEIPMLDKAMAGHGPLERLRPCVETAHALLAGAA